MNTATSSSPIAPATRLRSTDWRPSVGSTRDDCTTSSVTGSAPEFRRSESSFAVCVVKFPSMTPDPELNTTWMTGAEISFPSRVIWTGWPTKSFDSWIQRWSSGDENSKFTTGFVPFWNVTNVGFRCSPVSGGSSDLYWPGLSLSGTLISRKA